MTSANNIEVIPSAGRLIISLRDLGYDFPTAVAELVDNSIEAQATSLTIDVVFAGKGSWVMVADNGSGMSPNELREAMRFGTERDYDEHSLGKFGLGLKTASISQCRTVTVATRTSKQRATITAYTWDVDHVIATNRWEILPRIGPDIRGEICDALVDHPGTVVMWEQLDRVLDYRDPKGAVAKRGLAATLRELEEHLAMVFHRFLSGENKGKRLSIDLAGNKLKPWDPFARQESKTDVLESKEFAVSQDGTSGEVVVSPYILPHKKDFSSPDEFRVAAGPNKWNRQQGLYVYREDRMIQSGGWSGLRTIDEHTKLARISIDFESPLDNAFKTNVSKMKVQIPPSLKDDLKAYVNPIVGSARKVYDQRERDGKRQRRPDRTWTIKQIERMLKKLADKDEKKVIARLFSQLKRDIKKSY